MTAALPDGNHSPDVEARDGGETPVGVVDLPAVPPEARILKPLPEITPVERIVGAFAAAAMITSLAAIIIGNGLIVIVAGVLSAFVGPYAYFQQTKLTEITALKETQAAVQKEVNRLKNENNCLEERNSKLGDSIERLEDVKTALETLTSTNGQTIDEFESQIAKNRQTLQVMQTGVRDVLVQTLYSNLERFNADRDSKIEAHEIEDSLEQIALLEGVTVNKANFRKTFNGLPTESLMSVLRNMVQEDLPAEEKIFTFLDQ